MAEIDVVPTAYPPVKAGRLKVLATGSAKRLAMLPDVPTIAEAGVPATSTRRGTDSSVLANMPKDVLDKLHEEIVAH